MYTDPIADMLNRIRNAQAVEKKSVDIPFSMIKMGIAKTMEKEGLLEKITLKNKEKKRLINIALRYENNEPVINELTRISSPGQRIYRKSKEIRKVKGGRGVSILSTSKGVMEGGEAKKKGLGGEVLCEIW